MRVKKSVTIWISPPIPAKQKEVHCRQVTRPNGIIGMKMGSVGVMKRIPNNQFLCHTTLISAGQKWSDTSLKSLGYIKISTQ
jgi:hypothetical protein